MPEHIHVLLYPQRPAAGEVVAVSALLRDFKQYVGFHGKATLRDYWREHRSLWSDPLDQWARGELGEQAFWNTRGYDLNVDSLDVVREKLDYCHENPVKRGLVAGKRDWAWSSCRFYESGDDSLLGMDWDGGWPLEW